MKSTEKYNRIRPLKIWEILQRATDEDHPIGTEELLSKLLECGIEAHRSLISAMFDLFGENTKILSSSNEAVRFRVNVQVSDLFFGWCCSFADKVRLLGPKNVIERLKEYTDLIKEQYE